MPGGDRPTPRRLHSFSDCGPPKNLLHPVLRPSTSVAFRSTVPCSPPWRTSTPQRPGRRIPWGRRGHGFQSLAPSANPTRWPVQPSPRQVRTPGGRGVSRRMGSSYLLRPLLLRAKAYGSHGSTDCLTRAGHAVYLMRCCEAQARKESMICRRRWSLRSAGKRETTNENGDVG